MCRRFSCFQTIFWINFLLLTLSTIAFSQSQQLKLNSTIEREISEGEAHSYQVSVKKGEFVRILVSQNNTDVSLEGFLPNQQKFASVDNSNTREENEKISFVAENDGDFRFEVGFIRKLTKTDGKGYQIKLEAQRISTPKDKILVTAESLYNQANLLRFKKDKDSKLNAINVFRQAIPLFVEAEDKLGEGFATYAVGQVLGQLSEYQQSQLNYEKAAQLFREVNDLPQLALTLENSAPVYFRQSNLPKTIEVFNEATRIYQQTGNKRGEVSVLSKFGLIYDILGQPRKAIQTYQETLPILQNLGDQLQEATTLSNLALVYDDIGEPILALENYEKALALRRKIKNGDSIPTTLNNMSFVYRKIGENQKFLNAINEALDLFRERGNKEGEGTCLNNLATWYFSIGDLAKSEELQLKSLEIWRELKLKTKEARSLANLGDLKSRKLDPTAALEFYNQALQTIQTEPDKQVKVNVLIRIGAAWKDKLDFPKAVENLNQALTLSREIEDRESEADIQFYLSQILWQGGEKQRTLELLQKVLEIQNAIKDQVGLATTLNFLSKVQMEMGQLADAQNSCEKALEIIETGRRKIEREDFRASFLADKQAIYAIYLDVLTRRHKIEPTQGYGALALQVSERARARNLLESLGENQINFQQGVDKEIINKESKLRQTINEKEFRRTQLILEKGSQNNISALEKEIGDLIEKHRQVQTEIREANPNFAKLIEPQPLNLQQIQTEVLDDETVLLEYFLGENKSWLFLVTKNGIEIFDLPKKSEIEAVAKPLIATLHEIPVRKNSETDLQLKTRLENTKRIFDQKNTELSRTLLSPILDKINGQRLLIVGSDILQYVPFAVLQKPGDSKYLIETNEIVNLPSASVLSILRKINKTQPTTELALLADPVFELTDTRVKSQIAKIQKVNQNLPGKLRGGLKRLEFSRFEAEAISNLFSNDKKTVVLDFQANLPLAKSANFSQARFVHLATHGWVNSETPELSGVVLSLVNEKGEEQDGFLRLNDIYNLRLSADLVVLSACETALGEEIKGEGIIGLTRGFMYAGASSVVSTLWSVDDRATYQLMQRFYQAMLKDKLRPAAALRKAQISLLKENGYENPFYWAAFTIQGEFH